MNRSRSASADASRARRPVRRSRRRRRSRLSGLFCLVCLLLAGIAAYRLAGIAERGEKPIVVQPTPQSFRHRPLPRLCPWRHPMMGSGVWFW